MQLISSTWWGLVSAKLLKDMAQNIIDSHKKNWRSLGTNISMCFFIFNIYLLVFLSAFCALIKFFIFFIYLFYYGMCQVSAAAGSFSSCKRAGPLCLTGHGFLIVVASLDWELEPDTVRMRHVWDSDLWLPGSRRHRLSSCIGARLQLAPRACGDLSRPGMRTWLLRWQRILYPARHTEDPKSANQFYQTKAGGEHLGGGPILGRLQGSLLIYIYESSVGDVKTWQIAHKESIAHVTLTITAKTFVRKQEIGSTLKEIITK